MTETGVTRRTGHFQTLMIQPLQAVIHDDIYGIHTITEPILVELLGCAAVTRLAGVHQAGITGFLNLLPAKVTRLEHSIGAFLLVRLAGAAVSEQVAGLLHDISHTAFSHVVDYALAPPAGSDVDASFHEIHKMRYVQSTSLPDILTRHGFGDLAPLDEEQYGLVERPAPHLCADRLDYGLRDAVMCNKLSLEQAHEFVAALKAHPSPTVPERMLVVTNAAAAARFARAYMAIDRDVWSHPAQVDLYRTSGRLIGEAVRAGALREEQLWELSDAQFWEALRGATDEAGRAEMAQLEGLGRDGLPDAEGMRLPAKTKVRTVDPDVWVIGAKRLMPLTEMDEGYKRERRAYLEGRDALRDPGLD